ncbi:hypothetical protein niasHT_004837 [Heterodera trifolii]|uniref:DNA-directed DNA polymerase n=1 Tax=Heterodera trifolii TaxID=157864 RepID=A0ABD2LUK5_9BILA
MADRQQKHSSSSSFESVNPKRICQDFMSDQISGIVQQGAGGIKSSKRDAETYVKKLDSSIEHVVKYHYAKVKSQFSIEDVPADPEGLLVGIFQYCIDNGIKDSRERGIEPTHVGCVISSPLLDGGDIPIPLRKINDNTIDSILNLFLKVAQSKRQQKVTLWGEPFTVTITTVDRSGLPFKRHVKGGKRRKLATVSHQINDQCLIKISNPDEFNYCLFYALQATMVAKTRGWPRWKLHRYLNNKHGEKGKLQYDAVRLIQQIDAPMNLDGYDADTFVPRIVDHWNNSQQQHRFAVFIFGSSGQYKPLYKYIDNSYDTPLLLYYSNNHFDGVQKQGGLFGKPYCLECERPYDKASEHSKSCKARCVLCSRIDVLYRIVAFDLETMQHQTMDPNQPEKRQHQPNFIAARVACPDCIENGKWKRATAGCQICGPYRTVAFCQRRFVDTQVDKQVVTENPLKAFVDWLVFQLPKKYDTYAYSHFGGRFDMVLVFRELFRIGFNPNMLRKGNKLYEMKVHQKKKSNPNIIFRDSYNLMPCALGELVPSYGLDVDDKPFFPHLANRPENYGREIFPTPNDYLASGMMPEKRKKFDEWYAEHRHEPFLLDEALPSYCTNDVEILMAALVAFRREFFEVSRRNEGIVAKRAASDDHHDGIDVLRECMTIAGACMRHFRMNHLPAEHLAIVPERGYDNAQNQSELSRRFLNWYMEHHKVHVQMANSSGGEKRIGQYFVDGWVEAERKAIEVNGCVWHACTTCYPDDEMLMPNGKTAGAVRERNAKRMEFIQSQVDKLEVYWECEIERMLAKDKQMRTRFEEYPDDGPLRIRDAFMGGRTGPLKLLHTVGADEKISYFDFTSLYPYINCTTRYPVGHPKVHVLNQEVEWRSAADNPYPLALLKVWVVPPRQIDVPVLPVKVDDRLCFPLCMKCTKEHPKGGMKKDYKCYHSDEQRGWVSTCTSIELNAALNEGYLVTKVFRVLEYEQSDDKLFRPYIAEFMAQKIQASGFDSSIRGNAEKEQQFVRECAEQFDITIDPTKMAANKGKRSIAKLCLNNLWGRFSLRNYGLSQTLITDDPAVLGDFLDNRSIDVMTIDELDEEHILITYEKKKEWVTEHGCSNIVISLWTTSAARLLLLKAMQKVVRTIGCQLFYTDTDSLVLSHPLDFCPLKTGQHLGEFTDEYPDHEILEFCSGGAKQYGLVLRRKNTSSDVELEYVLKVRGMTLNYDVINNQGLRYETFKQQVMRYARTGEIEQIRIEYPNFLQPSIRSGGSVTSTQMQKCYRPYTQKQIMSQNNDENSQPPVLDGPYPRAQDDIEFVEDEAPVLLEVLDRLSRGGIREVRPVGPFSFALTDCSATFNAFAVLFDCETPVTFDECHSRHVFEHKDKARLIYISEDGSAVQVDGVVKQGEHVISIDTLYLDKRNEDFRLSECIPSIERTAQQCQCVQPVPRLGSMRDEHLDACVLMETVGSGHRLYIFEFADCVQVL